MAKREEKPVYLNDDIFKNTYRRNWEGDYRCAVIEVKAMLRDQTENAMDMNVIETLFVNQLNMESVHGYRNRHHSFVILSFKKKATTKSDNKKATAKTQQQLQEIQTKMRTGKEYKLEEICKIIG